ncbi:MAG: LamG domain-containing protein [Thaumarchaeota archaeon]|nr:LamG domain-containing protein [Nitrososphaerota archaeon]
MPIVGYANKLSVRDGDEIAFMVSCDAPSYRARLVRLVGSATLHGGHPRTTEVQSSLNGEHIGKRETFHRGSYVVIPSKPTLGMLESFSFQAWVYPTLPGAGRQVIVSSSGPRGAFALFLDEMGRLAVSVGGPDGIHSELPIEAKQWYCVGCSYEASGRLVLYQSSVIEWPGGSNAYNDSGPASPDCSLGGANVMIGAQEERQGGGLGATGFFNGKLDSPRMFSKALSVEEFESLALGMPPGAFEPNLVASWDFSSDIMSARVTDVSGHEMNGWAVNVPKRAVTGYNWKGREMDFRLAPKQYGAIYFHEDDLDDAGWLPDFTLKVPSGMKSGVYAVHLESAGSEDYIPFIVRPPERGRHASIAFLLPTLTYIAYSNFHSYTQADIKALRGLGTVYPARDFERYNVTNRLLGLYDLHRDGSGVSMTSRLKPLLAMRPGFLGAHLSSGKGAAHLLSADLFLAEWMEQKGFDFDVITDEDLHDEGLELLRPYRVVLTGSHPEYYTEKMLDAMEAYLKGGGRMMYLGGNGFYWVTSIDPQRAHLFEVRRWGATQGWRSEPGEYHHSTTGEMGGSWRNRGRAEHKLVGVGFSGEGVDVNRPYRRMPQSFDPEVAFVFEGIGKDELIGDLDNEVLEHGAAGFEIDRVAFDQGTPGHTKLLARSTAFPDSYLHAIEELNHMEPDQTGSTSPLVRADMVLLEYPKGGAVFSVGSISWCGCFPRPSQGNNVAKITENVLRRFSSDRTSVSDEVGKDRAAQGSG